MELYLQRSFIYPQCNFLLNEAFLDQLEAFEDSDPKLRNSFRSKLGCLEHYYY